VPLFAPSSLLAHKRRRFDAAASLSSPSLQFGDDMTGEDDSNNEEDEVLTFTPQLMPVSQPTAFFSSSSYDRDPPSSGLPLPHPSDRSMQASMDLSARMQQSVNHLEATSQAVQLQIAHKEQSDKSTMISYARHVNAYTTWWDTYQASVLNKDPGQVAIPAFPITAAKATMFLEYTSTRLKVSVPFLSPMYDF
jgi:hypothetical protein